MSQISGAVQYEAHHPIFAALGLSLTKQERDVTRIYHRLPHRLPYSDSPGANVVEKISQVVLVLELAFLLEGVVAILTHLITEDMSRRSMSPTQTASRGAWLPLIRSA